MLEGDKKEFYSVAENISKKINLDGHFYESV